MKKKILITGIDGFLGTYLAKTYNSEKYFLQGTCYDKQAKFSENNLQLNYLDVTDRTEVIRVLNKLDPDIIIHTAGNSNTDISENNPALCYKTTVYGTKNIADWCNLNHKQLIYCSTNAIFSGDEAPYNESSIPFPLNRYGMHKYMAERIAATVDSYLIFRLILMYGWNYSTRMNPVTFVIKALREEKKLNMVEGSSYVNPLYIDSCCDGIWQGIALEKNREIYHLAGKETVDRYNLALAVAEIFELDKNLISSVPDEYFASLAKRPYDSSYNTKKAEVGLGFKPLTLKEGLIAMKREEVI
jgi:dTDP-4-dehydrorhamnose reductase